MPGTARCAATTICSISASPKSVRDIHLAYFRAGADIVSTNTFSSTSIAQADYGMQEHRVRAEFRGRAAGARGGAHAPRTTMAASASSPARSGRPTAPPSISPDVSNPGFRAITFDQLRDAYAEQVRGLLDGGADLLLIETIFDTLNAKAAIHAILDETEARGVAVPIMISGTITDLSGRLLSGQTPAAFWNSVRHAAPFSVGLNCALGAKEMRAHIAELAASPTRWSAPIRMPACRTSSGSTTRARNHGRAARRIRQRRPGQHRRRLLRHDAGAYPRHRGGREGQAAAADPGRSQPLLRLSGWSRSRSTAEIPFVNVGERTNVTGSAKFRKLVTAGDYNAALAIARDQVENGAQVIDVNMDEGLLDSKQAMVTFLNLIASEPDIALVPVMIDLSKFRIIEAGLKCAPQRLAGWRAAVVDRAEFQVQYGQRQRHQDVGAEQCRGPRSRRDGTHPSSSELRLAGVNGFGAQAGHHQAVDAEPDHAQEGRQQHHGHHDHHRHGDRGDHAHRGHHRQTRDLEPEQGDHHRGGPG